MNRPRHESGFTLIELLITVGIVGVLMVGATVVMPNLVKQSRADGATAQVLNTLRLARDRAIGERRNLDLVFTAPNRIQVVREEIGGSPNTTIVDVSLENRLEFLYVSGMGDTPEAFGLTNTPIAFGPVVGTVPTIMFTSEGTLVDSSGDTINGTLFLGTPGDRNSARAITFFGPTALLKAYRWDGSKWTE